MILSIRINAKNIKEYKLDCSKKVLIKDEIRIEFLSSFFNETIYKTACVQEFMRFDIVFTDITKNAELFKVFLM